MAWVTSCVRLCWAANSPNAAVMLDMSPIIELLAQLD